MENESKINHEYLIRLDDELSNKLIHYSRENDMTITGSVRKSLRHFFVNEGLTGVTRMVKRSDHLHEDRDQ